VPDDWIADGLDARAPVLQQVLAFALPSLWQRDAAWCERLLQYVLETNVGLAVGLLDARREPLSREFSAALVQQVFASLARWGYPAAGLLRDLPLRLDPSAAGEVRTLLDRFTEPAWAWAYLERLADTLEIRAAMRRELEL
jgi:hypothetical protein